MRFFSEKRIVDTFEKQLDVSSILTRQSMGTMYFGRTPKGRYTHILFGDNYFVMVIEFQPDKMFRTKKLRRTSQFIKMLRKFVDIEHSLFENIDDITNR